MRYRDYQSYAFDSIFRYFESGKEGNPLVAMPTGTGKSVVIGGFVREVFARYPGQRLIMLTHVKELIEQNLEKLVALWPTAPAGVFSAGLGRREAGFPITYAGIASVAKRPELFGHVDLVLIDEAHLVSPKDGTMYQRFLAGLRAANPNIKVIGFTATHYRMGQGMLTDEGGLFTDLCVDMTGLETFNWFIQEGYLVPLIPKRTMTELAVEGVRVQHGEFNQRELQAAVDREEITHAAVREAVHYASDRTHWLVFASGIEHAENVAGMLETFGVSATFVHSKMASAERDQRIADFKAGRYRAMVNNGILTTGFDFPAIDALVVLRPTQSPGLWVQMLGRGTRPFYASGFDLETTEGRLTAIAQSPKRDCLVLDFAANTRRLGPINDPVVPRKKGKGGGEAPVRVCEECLTYCHASLRVCPHCGSPFPIAVKFTGRAATEELIRKADAPEVHEFVVSRVVYAEHTKEGRPPSLKATYYCGLRMFQEWICLEHDGFARKKARDWWRRRTNGTEPPVTVKDAFTRLAELRVPASLRVWVNRRHPEILGARFPGEEPQGEAPVSGWEQVNGADDPELELGRYD